MTLQQNMEKALAHKNLTKGTKVMEIRCYYQDENGNLREDVVKTKKQLIKLHYDD